MTQKQLAILFTGMVPVPGTLALAHELLPGARIVSIVDDSLLDDVIVAGHLTRTSPGASASTLAAGTAVPTSSSPSAPRWRGDRRRPAPAAH